MPPLVGWERVRVKMEARGEIYAPTGEDGNEVRRPFSSTARFDFLEGVTELSGPTSAEAASVPHGACGVRHFLSASSELSIAEAKIRRVLRPTMSTLAISRSPSVKHFAADAFLTREEAELLTLAFDPLLVDQLIPKSGEADASTHSTPELTAALLAIDTVGRPTDAVEQGAATNASEAPDAPPRESGLLDARRVPPSAEGEPAKLTVTGTVHGAVDGVPTTIEVDGTFDLDVEGTRIKGGLVRLRERRMAGHVSPGFECDATFQMARRPAEGPQAAPAIAQNIQDDLRKTWGSIAAGAGRGDPEKLLLEDPQRRFTLEYDARWRDVADDSRGFVLRMVDEGALLAECTVSPLPKGATGTGLEQFKNDIERSLAERLGRFLSAAEQPRDDGVKNLRVASEGAVGDVPIEWRHHLLEAADGERLVVTFMVEKRFAERFGRADADFVAGLALGRRTTP